MGTLRRPMLALIVLGLLGLISLGSPLPVEAEDHPPCEPLPGASQSSCVVVDAEPFTPGEQSSLYVFGNPSSFEVDVVLRLDPVAAPVAAFNLVLNYDTSLIQAGVPEAGPSFQAAGFICDVPPASADWDGNPATGDAFIVCFLSEEPGPEMSGTHVLATVQFSVVASFSFNTTISLTDVNVFDAAGDEAVSCPQNIEEGGGCHAATISRDVGFDFDGDNIQDYYDNCVFRWNPGQEDADSDHMGDECDPDADNDGFGNLDDTCPLVVNLGQENADSGVTDLQPWGKAYDDITWPVSDDDGDACDADDDNDGLSDAVEAGGPPCAPATGNTDPLLRDTDGDGVLDGAECALGSNPTNAVSVPPAIVLPDADGDSLPDALDPNDADVDSDDDGMPDGREFRYFNSNSSSANSDTESCEMGGGVVSPHFRDGREVASVNGDWSVNSIDLAQVAQHFSMAPDLPYIPHFDMNKDGRISSIDLSFVAQQFGGCG